MGFADPLPRNSGVTKMIGKIRSALLASAMALAATGVSAQTAFDGPYVGVGAGFGSTSFSFAGAAKMPSARGGFASVIAGWNTSNGNMLYGFEGDLSIGNMRRSAACANPDWTCRSRVQGMGSLRGRLGVVQGSTLIYGTAGVAAARIGLRTSEPVAGTFSDRKTVPGLSIGAGVEVAMGNDQSFRAEVMHTRFRSRTWNLDEPYTNGRARMTTGRVSWLMRF
jgi:outer membrane immunogenic protein